MSTVKSKIAVTGATGFLGSHLVEELLERGHEVSALARDTDKANRLPPAATSVIGDIGDGAVLDSLVEGCDVVVHTVSNFRTASGPPESYTAINVEGTRCALEAAERAGVRRFVHISTIGVHGHVAETPADERSAFNPGDLYQKTKLEAERLALETAGKSSMEVVVIRPCSMYGPGDLRMLKMFRMLVKGTFFKVGPCRENFHAVYIDDVVDGIIRAAFQPDLNGEVFIIGGPEYLPLDQYIDTAASALGVRRPWIRIPYWPLASLAWAMEKTLVPLGVEPPLHPRRVRFFRNNRAFAIDKAKRVLDYRPCIDLPQGMSRTIDWYREQGLLPVPQTRDRGKG